MKTNITPKEAILYRAKVLQKLRAFFLNEDFIEVATPIMIAANAPDPFVDPFLFQGASDGRSMQLHTSPEICLKQALAEGFPRIYDLAKVFRDERPGKHHSREFTMLEWYRKDADLSILLNDTQAIAALIAEAWSEIRPGAHASYNYIICTTHDLFEKYAQIDLNQVLSLKRQGDTQVLQRVLKNRNDYLPNNASFLDAFFHTMVKYVEPNLPAETLVYIHSWPAELAALSEIDPQNDLYCLRFELYLGGLEIANAYQECNDPNKLRARFYADNLLRKSLGKAQYTPEESFFTAVKTLSKVAGIALGVDRLMMAIAKIDQIHEIMFANLDKFSRKNSKFGA